ncbi:hypothetical protein [Cloacibacillus evryensis]|uniref:hypothetical protein n=1 Tax=Cloacibacillus evryensis TaxID=508460 RepID=UPI003AB759BA
MRIVKDIPQDNSGLQIKARITDAYARPAVDDSASELEQLARSLVNVQPSIMKYLDTKAEEKKDFDTNRGAALYNMLGENMPWEEAKKKLQNGDITGFKDINQNVKAGYIGERHKAAGMRFMADMQDWENKGVGTDKDGNQTALSSIESPAELMDIYSRKQAEVLQSYIGKSYAPEFYGKYIQPALDTNVKQFMARQSEARAAVLLDKRDMAFGETLNAFMEKLIVNNELVFDDTIYTPQGIANGMMELSQDIMAGGMPENEVNRQMTTMLRSMMYDYDIDNVDGLKDVAKHLPLWNNPEYRGIIEHAAKSAISGKRSNDAAKRAQEKQEAQDAIGGAFGSMLEKYNYDPAAIPAAEWTALMKIAPKTLDSVGWISSAQSAFESIHSRSAAQERGMPDEEFYRTYGDFATGRKNLGSLFSYAGRTTPEQYKELVGGYNLHQSVVKASGGGTGKADNSYTKTKAAALKMLTTGGDNKALDYNDAVLFDGVSSKISYDALQLQTAWKKKNPDASKVEQQIALEGFIRDRVKAYGGNLETYRDDPGALNKPPRQVKQESVLQESNAIVQSLPQKNATIEAACRRISEAVSNGGTVSFTPDDMKTLNQALKKTKYKGKADSLIKELVRLERELQGR